MKPVDKLIPSRNNKSKDINTPEMDSYTDVKKLIYDLIHKYLRKHGGEWEELLAECNLAFAYAYSSYKPEKSKFSTWTYWAVNTCLMENSRRCGKASRVQTIRLDEMRKFTVHNTRYSVIQRINELSNDARMMANEIINPSLDMLLNLKLMGKRHTPKRIKKSIVIYFQELGWSLDKIKKTFAELLEE